MSEYLEALKERARSARSEEEAEDVYREAVSTHHASASRGSLAHFPRQGGTLPPGRISTRDRSWEGRRGVLQALSLIPDSVLEDVRKDAPELAQDLIRNPALSHAHALRLAAESAREILSSLEGGTAARSYHFVVLGEAYRKEVILPSSPHTQDLLETIREGRSVRKWRGGHPEPAGIPGAQQTLHQLLRAPALSETELMEILHLAGETHSTEFLENLAIHPGASLALWRALARRVEQEDLQGHSDEVPEMLAQIPGARRDPEVRRILARHRERWGVRFLLCLDAAPDTREFFRELVETEPAQALKVASHPEFEAQGVLTREDLLPLLLLEDGELRIKAMAAMQSLLAEDSPERQRAREESRDGWRERYDSMVLPF